MDILQQLYDTVLERKDEKQEGSYTCYLFEQGLDKILKKCGEECSEVIIAAKTAKRGHRGRNQRPSLSPHRHDGEREHPA